MNNTDSNRKTIAITGATGGIGNATARLLATRGHRVMLASLDEPKLQKLAEDINASGGEAAHHRTDVTDPENVRSLVESSTSRFGSLDVMANIAGVAINAPLHAGELADWERMIDVNLRGVLHGIAAALPVFRNQGSGQFVTVTSTAAQTWVPGQGVYAATKTAVRALCEVLRQELAEEGLRSTVISPGFTNTDFIASTRDPEELAALTARRDAVAMAPTAVAEAIAFAIDRPDAVDIGEVVLRSTRQP